MRSHKANHTLTFRNYCHIADLAIPLAYYELVRLTQLAAESQNLNYRTIPEARFFRALWHIEIAISEFDKMLVFSN